MNVVIIPPDASGSKGDEAVVRGALNVFDGAPITIITPGNGESSWKTELSDRSYDFFEEIVSSNGISENIIRSCILVVLGTDVIDGTGLKSSSLSRLEAVEKNSMLGGRTAVFMSFRKDVDKEIIEKIKEIDSRKKGDIIWACRDAGSINNFEEQTGIKCQFFPDFAFYSEKQLTDRVKKINDYISGLKEQGKTIVGVNFSSHSFSSFYDYSRENVETYIHSIIDPICDIEKDPFFVLISHDTRNVLGGLPSDFDFSYMASQIIQKETMVLPWDLRNPELQSIIHEMDYVVTGRMHVSVSSIIQNVPPIIFTGKGRASFSMIDKCYGMFEDRIGRKDLVATNDDELKNAIKVVKSERDEIRDAILRNNKANQIKEKECLNEIRSKLKIELRNEFKVESTEYGIIIQTIRKTIQSIRVLIENNDNRCTEIDDYCRKLNDYCDGLQYRIDQLEKEKDGLQYRIDQLEKTYDKIEKNKIKWLFGRLD